MKISLLIYSIVLISCVSHSITEHLDSSLNVDIGKKDSSIIQKYYFQNDTVFFDTLRINNYDIYLQTIERKDFIAKLENIAKNGYSSQDSLLKEKLNNYSFRVHDSILHIKLLEGNEISFTNSKARIGEYVDYKYVGFCKRLNSHIIHVQGDDTGGYFLVNPLQKDSVIDLFYNFCINANWTRLITYDWDNFAFSSGKFDLFDISGGKFKKILSYSNDFEQRGYFWFLNDFHFISDSEAIYIHEIQKYGGVYPERKCYAQMRIVRKACP